MNLYKLKIMKKFYTLLFFSFINLVSQAQIVNIPDANFKTKLLAASPTNQIAKNQFNNFVKIDVNNNSEIEVSEASLISYLNISNSTIANLTGIQSFVNLTFLNCSTNQLTALNLTNNTLLSNLQCFDNQLISITGIATNIRDIGCSNNQLTTLNVSNKPMLFNLKCNNNLLTSLNITNTFAISSLDYSTNQIQNINLTPLAASLQTLVMGGNPYTSIVNITSLINLNFLDVGNIGLNYFPLNQLNMPLFTNLTTLKNNNVPLGNINYGLIPNLQFLSAQNTNLTAINLTNLTNIRFLLLGLNQLDSIDVTPLPNLESLVLNSNPLSSILFGNHPLLASVFVTNSNMTSLDFSFLPALSSLSVNSNSLLTTLNIKNNRNENANFSNCPNLEYICADDSQINTIQSRIASYGYTNCHVNSYCSFVPGGNFYTIQGNTRFDNNSNGCDVTDITAGNQKFNISSVATAGTLIADESGTYSIFVQSGTHTITPQFENPSYFNVSPATTTVTFPASPSPFTQNFCVTANGVKNDVETTIIATNPARPGFDANYKIIYKNKGNQVSNGSLNFNFNDAKMDLVSALPVNNSAVTNSLVWNYTGLNPFETREINLVFNINSPMETPAVNGGDVLNYTATIVGTTDIMPSDNTMTLNQTVVNSFDPNDKICLEGNTITPTMVGNFVHYVIRFENTGTFAAQNVVVSDFIDLTKFEIASLVPQRSSHSFATRINNASGKVEFIFENINLPFDDANNDGYVAFKIKTKSTLVLGNTFTNKANIYFDFNFPIITNTVSTIVAALNSQDFEFGTYFTLYPTPAKEELNINVNGQIDVRSVAIYTMLGQLVLAYTTAETITSLDVSQLKTGTYFIKLVTNKGTASQKFIKE